MKTVLTNESVVGRAVNALFGKSAATITSNLVNSLRWGAPPPKPRRRPTGRRPARAGRVVKGGGRHG